MKLLKKLFSPSEETQRAHAIYAGLVEVARQPQWYTDFGVPDTLDGRFEMVLLQLYFKNQELKNNLALARAVNEAFVADMDRNLREMGVSDTGVPKRIKHMGAAWLGRMDAYEKATTPEAFVRAIHRNVFREAPGSETAAQELAAATYRLS